MAFPAGVQISYGQATSAGLISNSSRSFGLGYNPSVSAGQVADTWGGAGLYPWWNVLTTMRVIAGATDVFNTGTGAWQIQIIGLDTNFNPKTQLVNLNGATPVTVDTLGQPIEFRAINGIRVTQAGSTGAAGANVQVQDAAGPNTLRGLVIAGKQVARQSAFTVRDGYSLFVDQIRISCDVGTGSDRFVVFETYFQDTVTANAPFILPLSLGVTPGSPFDSGKIDPPIVVASRNRFGIRVSEVSGSNLIARADWNGTLRKNT